MITIDDWEADGAGGYYIRFTDPSQPITAYIHATPGLLDELGLHHRRHRGAPEANLAAAQDGMRDDALPDAATVALFRVAYSEVLADIIDLRTRGLRPDTPHGVHVEARRTGETPLEWRVDRRPDKYLEFIERKP